MPHPRFGMDRRDYLTDRYWAAFDKLVAGAAESGFTLHLYDEFNWSSGPAGGRVTANVEYCALGLGMRHAVADGPDVVTFDEWTTGYHAWGSREQYVSIVRIPVTGSGGVNLANAVECPAPPNTSDVVHVSVPAGSWHVYVFYTVRTQHPSPLRQGNGGIIDYLNPDATKAFIGYTHDQYAARYQDKFGSTIPSIFYDESGPYACGCFTWTCDLLDQFANSKGYNLRQYLPLLFVNGGEMTEKVRADYWDTVATLFAERHVGQMADWCAAHGIALTGHTYEEPERWMIAGDALRTLRRQQWPGFDSLGGYKAFHHLKPASSVPALTGGDVLLCESLGLLGLWECSPRMMREAYNQLAIVGVTHQVPHAFFQTVDNPLVECPPSFFEHNPYWKYYEQIAELTSRQCWINRNSRLVVDVAVFWPIVSWWGDAAGGRGETFPWDIATRQTDPSRGDRLQFEAIVDSLMADHIDHVIADGTALADAEFSDGAIALHSLRCQVLVLPPMSTVRREDLARIVIAARAGVTVIAVERLPSVSMEDGRNDPQLIELAVELQKHAQLIEKPCDVAALVRAKIQPDITLIGDVANIVTSHRHANGEEIYAVHNHETSEQKFQLRLRSVGSATLWDADTGMRSTCSFVNDSAFTTVDLILAPNQLTYVVISNTAQALEPAIASKQSEAIALLEQWSMLPVPSELDREWSCGVGPQEIGVPVFRTRELTSQPRTSMDADAWPIWHIPDYDDSSWETAHCARGPLLFNETGSRLFRIDIPLGADAIKLPLPIAGEYALYVNGVLGRVVLGHDDQQAGWLPLRQGGGILGIEVGSMAPNFGITTPVVFRCAPVKAPLTSWTEQGLWWYSGRIAYRSSFMLENDTQGGVSIDLGDVRECAEVWVNGKLAGVRLWPPYRLDISEWVVPGCNSVEVIVANLISNKFAWDVWGSRGEGRTLPSGLLGPVLVLVQPLS
ncbi:MAG TPA: glycosyl hydrolase [Capsulimonadaceae bacterium]